MAKDDKLGIVDVEWMDCFTNPTMWEMNKLMNLQGEQDMGSDLGRIYVQMKFLQDGQESTPEGIRACDTIEELKNDYGRVLGNVQVKIISASQLVNADLVGKSDPYVECFLSNEDQKKMKTKVIPDCLDPRWDFDGSLTISMLRIQVQQNTIHFDVKDDDEVGSDFLGSVDIDLIDILEKNP